MASVRQIIGKVNPRLYAENGKELLKKYKFVENIPADEVKPKALAEHSLVYDSPSETLEPVYFYIIDLMSTMKLETEKLVDNFSSTPGSGHFVELGGRATIMQQQATKILGDVNTVLRSVLSIIYDLKEFKTRLLYYDNLNSKDKKEASLLSLKQIWLDKVDIQKGNTSVKAMAFGQGGFQTLIDAFLIAKDEKDADKIDLNDRVKRILKPRIQEFNIWLRESERELRKRYELERGYLRSQVNSLKLYSRWAKPYLRAAAQLEMSQKDREPALVKAFNTILLELGLFGKAKVNVKDAALEGKFPIDFQKLNAKRDYFHCALVEFKFRGIPQRAGQQSHYVFGGKAEVKFAAYALNSDEIELMNRELEKDDVNEVLKLVEGSSTESLGHMQEEINSFLEEDSREEKKQPSEANPFFALAGFYEGSGKKTAKKEKKDSKDRKIAKDDWIEANYLRKLAMERAKDAAFNLFDIYKQAHGMVSYT
jgi:hypothetical protein